MTDNDKIELINAMMALRRYHDTVLLKDLGPSGEVKMASAGIARHLDLVLTALPTARLMISDAVQEDQRFIAMPDSDYTIRRRFRASCTELERAGADEDTDRCLDRVPP